MADVLTTVAERKRPDADVIIDLDSKPLSAVLRSSTWRSHTRAEYSPFEVALVQGVLPKAAYAELMAQTLFIYQAIEECAAAFTDDPIAGPFCFAELTRIPAIEADLAFYFGPEWRDLIAPLPITSEYTARIRAVAAEGPERFVAHHYTRYLADLSGGVAIDGAITRAYGLEEDGRRFYVFDIPDFDAFKGTYRGLLDQLPLTVDQQVALIDEAAIAYEFNIALVNDLTERFGPFAIDTAAMAGGHHHH